MLSHLRIFFLVVALCAVVLASSPVDTEEVSLAGMSARISDITANEIRFRCNNYQFRCNDKKLDLYLVIAKEFADYTSSSTVKVAPLTINAQYMVMSSLVKRRFHEMGFVGFYTVETGAETDQLEIGPYASNITATPVIMSGKGVCGETWQRGETMVVPDVTAHPNYISCDDVTMSEIVVPVHDHNQTIRAVFDIDADVRGYFDETDKICLEEIVKLLNF